MTCGCKSRVLTGSGNSPLHICSLRGHHLLAQYLVSKSFPLDVLNQRGETPLHTAVRQLFLVPGKTSQDVDSLSEFEKSVKIIEVLIKAGSDIKSLDNKGQSLLFKLLTGSFTGCVNSHVTSGWNHRRLYLIRLVLSATDRISGSDLPPGGGISSDLCDLYPDFLPWLMTFSRSPRSLQHIARCKVRSVSPSRELTDQGFQGLCVTFVMKDYLGLNGV